MGVMSSMGFYGEFFRLRVGDRGRFVLGFRGFLGLELGGLLSLQQMEVIGPIFIINQEIIHFCSESQQKCYLYATSQLSLSQIKAPEIPFNCDISRYAETRKNLGTGRTMENPVSSQTLLQKERICGITNAASRILGHERKVY